MAKDRSELYLTPHRTALILASVHIPVSPSTRSTGARGCQEKVDHTNPDWFSNIHGLWRQLLASIPDLWLCRNKSNQFHVEPALKPLTLPHVMSMLNCHSSSFVSQSRPRALFCTTRFSMLSSAFLGLRLQALTHIIILLCIKYNVLSTCSRC